MSWDYFIFQKLNNLANHKSAAGFYFDAGIIFLADFLIFFIPVLILIFYLLAPKIKKIIYQQAVIVAALSAAFAFSVSQIIGKIYFRPRPFVFYPETVRLIKILETISDKSFPSDHTTVSFAIAFAVFFYNRFLGWTLLIIALLIGLARIVAGVHYPTDIFGGITLGLLSAFLVRKFFENKIKNKIWLISSNN